MATNLFKNNKHNGHKICSQLSIGMSGSFVLESCDLCEKDQILSITYVFDINAGNVVFKLNGCQNADDIIVNKTNIKVGKKKYYLF